ncbi:SR-related and CTD-associated factor 4 isoform X2 [Anguilla rostrata]|uniref:SR-related and CTD-associated factor 4 isoform X2 n=1 Tax=Anguilla rostrata TaxID=7938 RepID=UPI0030CCA3F5
MDAVNAFNQELFSLMDMKPPISRAKMISITKSAIKAIKLYKHVVQIVEKFIKKCKPEYKVPGLYVVDSIVRQSRHQFGADKDVFGPRFTKNITGTFENLCLCPTEDRSKIVRVLNLWQKNGVFRIEIIQPLLDMAAGSSSSAAPPDAENDVPDAGSPSTPVKAAETQPPVTANSIVAAVPQLQNSDAFAAVAQLFQSSQGQQLQQMLQTFQQPGRPQSPAVENSMMTQLQHHGPAPVPAPVPVPAPQHNPLLPQPVEQKAAFDKKLLDRFDYDDEPEGADDGKKDDSTAAPPPFGFPDSAQQQQQQQQQGYPHMPAQMPAHMPAQIPHMEHFPPHMMGMTQDPAHQVPLPPNGQLQGYGMMHGQPFPGMMQPMGQQLLQPGTAPPAFPGVYPPQSEAFAQHMAQQAQDVSMEVDPPLNKDGRHRPDGRRSRSRSASRSPKRRRSRSNSRSRRSRHRRSRSRSRDRRRHSPRSRSQERRERERERERRQKGLPSLKNETLSVCSTTLWVGQLDKRTQQQDVACLLEEFGQIESINMIPPRGCAYIVMVHRQDAFRALQKLSRGSYKVNQKAIKIAWALNKGIKPEYKQYWDVELGVTYIPWSKVKVEDLESFRQGGMLDSETLCPEWKDSLIDSERTDEVAQNGRSDSVQAEETPPAAPVQVPPVQPMGAVGTLQPPAFPAHMGLPPPNFPPGVPPPPPPPFMRPGFNPMQMPPGFMPPGPMPPLGSPGHPPPASSISMPTSGAPGSSVEDPSKDASGVGSRNSSEAGSMPPQMGNQVPGPPGMNMQPPSGGLLGARPGMIPLQRPPGVPPPHMPRFPPPRPNMPPMPPPMMHRGPPQMLHREPPPGGFGMPPPHPIRGPFPPHGPPFMRPSGPRGPEGPDERDGRPFRNERPGFGRDREQERFGGGGGARRPFGGERPEGRERDRERERFGGRPEEAEQRGGWEPARERRDWGRSPERERGGRDPEDRARRPAPGHRDREPGMRERSTRWDRDDRLHADEGDAPARHRAAEPAAPAAPELPPADSAKDSAPPETQPPGHEPEPTGAPRPEETLEPPAAEPVKTEPAEKPQEVQS